MGLLAEATAVIQTAEKGLCVLMEQAIQSGRYSELAQLAEMAKALGRVSRGSAVLDSSFQSDPLMGPLAIAHLPLRTKERSKAVSTKLVRNYPRFERHDDRLVKIGWSKREKSEYEHKAPRDAAEAVYLRLGKVPTTTTFKMEGLLPVLLPDGTEVPSYQSYLVLAWLRHTNQIEKRANDSYQWVVDEIDSTSFKKVWEATPRRGDLEREKRK